MSETESDLQHIADSIEDEFLIDSITNSAITIGASYELDKSEVEYRVNKLTGRDVSFRLVYCGDYNSLNNKWRITVDG